MIKMSPLRASIALLILVSATYADVSHLNGYHYPNLGTNALHTPQSPAPTQYHASYGDTLVRKYLPTSYAPPPSGSPFDSVAPLARQYAPQRLSAPQQSPVLTAQKYQSSTNYRPKTQPQAKYNQPRANNQAPPTYQAPKYRAPSTANAYSQTNSQPHTRQATPLVTKHFYVHAAPEEPEENPGPRYVQVGRPRKNYKIIFIKAPTYSTRSQIIPVIAPTEEKTIVYVLSKKPVIEQNVELPEPPVTEPSRPEVFFIKYRTQQEADQAQQSIQAAYDQANLANADTGDQIASQFVSLDSGSGVPAFGG